MPANRPKNNPCACGCGTLVTGTWARGHQLRGGRLPGPDEPVDLGELFPQPPPADGPELGDGSPAGPGYSEPAPRRGKLAAARDLLLGDSGGQDQDPGPGERLDPDPPPAHLGGARPRKGRPPRGKPVKVAAVTRGDIEAKVRLMLQVPGQVWAIRDPVCGAVFVECSPAIARSWTDLICQSPDLVQWFTGMGGGFILWLNAAAAMQPVAVAIWAHHVTHTVGEIPAGPNPTVDLSGYPA